MAPTRPSIMSDGAMMSQPASACDQRLLHQHRDGLVVEDDAVAHQPVMAVAGVGIERHIAQHADLRHRFLDGADRAADQIVRVERFGAVVVAPSRVGVGKQREAGDGELRRALGGAHRLVDRQALDARHRVDRRADVACRRPGTAARSGRRWSARSRAPCAAPIRRGGCGAAGSSGRADRRGRPLVLERRDARRGCVRAVGRI